MSVNNVENSSRGYQYFTDQWTYTRNLIVEIQVMNSDRAEVVAKLELKSSLESKKYLYQIRVVIDQTSRRIVNAGLDCLTPEAPACERTGDLMMKIIGLQLDEKYLWRISNIFGRKNGCRHLYELALEIGRAYSNMKLGEYMKTASGTAKNTVRDLIDLRNHCAGLSSLWKTGELT